MLKACREHRIFVCHPERQHSDGLATALESRGLLALYVYGGPLPQAVRAAIAPERRRQVIFSRLGRRLMRSFMSDISQLEWYYRLIWAFDWLMACRLRRLKCTAVVAYENSALYQFRTAKKLGMTCILDNSGIHHSLQDRMLKRRESQEFHATIVRRKDEELALADLILVCSNFALDSFVSGGVPAEKLRVVSLPCDILNFKPSRRSKSDGPLRFLFVGHVNSLKGADILADAVRTMRSESVPFELTIAAPHDSAEPDLLAAFATNDVRMLGRVPHDQLPSVYAEADCLVLPSRIDSFGVVVAEALASGIPVIVSDHVGAKDLVFEGRNGWIVRNGSVEDLLDRMRWCTTHPVSVRAMGKAARDSAESSDWDGYRARALDVIGSFLNATASADMVEAHRLP